jgi:hypothetical protein
MKKLLFIFTALILFSGAAICQDLQVRSINITNSTSGLKLNGKDVTNSVNTPTKTLVYDDSTKIDFKTNKFQQITLTDTLVLISKNLSPGAQVDLRITGAGASKSLTFPATWKFMGTKPTSLAANKTALLVMRSYSNSDGNVICVYSVEP